MTTVLEALENNFGLYTARDIREGTCASCKGLKPPVALVLHNGEYLATCQECICKYSHFSKAVSLQEIVSTILDVTTKGA